MSEEESRYKSPISGKSALLIRENPIILLPELAIRIGPDLAIIVQQIQYWLEQKEKSQTDRCFIEGKYWVYNTVKDWCKSNFPWWREDQLRRYLEALIETNIVIAKKFEAATWKQRKWYTLNYETLDKLYQSKVKVSEHRNQASLINEIKQLAILPKALANSPNQDPDFRQIELASFANSSINTETTSETTSETKYNSNENDNRSQEKQSNGSVDASHPSGSDRGESRRESQKSIEKTNDYQIFLDVYNENKPDRWSKAEKLTPTRIKMLDRLIRDYGDKSLTMLQRALVGAKRSQFWSGLDYKFDYLYREKGSNGENGDKITGLAESVPEEDLYSERVNLDQSAVEMMDDYKRMKAALAMFEQEAS